MSDEPTKARVLGVAVVVANGLFVLGWLVAPLWQGPRYHVLADSISDMYANHAPGGVVLIVVTTLSGIAVLLFAGLVLWPTLRPGGWSAAVGSILLALSIFGLGDLLTPFEREACRHADPGCTAAIQTGNLGGALDSTLSGIGVLLLVAAGFFLTAGMRRIPRWHHWSGPTLWATVGLLVLVVAANLTGPVNLSGLSERLVAAAGAAAIAALAIGCIADAATPASRRIRG